MYSFGEASEAVIEGADERLQAVLRAAIKVTTVDFSVVCSVRSRGEQEQAFADGLSKARWKESPHNYHKSWAVDVYPWPTNWADQKPWFYLGGLLTGVASGINVPLVWGGSWKSFVDLPHYEIATWREELKET